MVGCLRVIDLHKVYFKDLLCILDHHDKTVFTIHKYIKIYNTGIFIHINHNEYTHHPEQCLSFKQFGVYFRINIYE